MPGVSHDPMAPGPADGNAGRWAFHWRHPYHLADGMMTTLEYEGVV